MPFITWSNLDNKKPPPVPIMVYKRWVIYTFLSFGSLAWQDITPLQRGGRLRFANCLINWNPPLKK